jgi:membrane-bound metal-dependent hydrolase YbcI (DUF457 family)
LRILLFACLFGMLMVAVLYLRQRKLTTLAYFLWGLLALLLPILGPYLVITARPGEPHRPGI